MTRVLELIQNLAKLIHSESPTDLFERAFRTLFACLPFDAGVTVVLEQNLDLYILARSGTEGRVEDQRAAEIRSVLQTVIPAAIASAELVVKHEVHDLPSREHGDDTTEHEAHATLRRENRTAGILLISRTGEGFDDEERAILEAFATQVSMLLDNLIARTKILELADRDELTGIPNRRSFRRHLWQEMESARVYGVPLSLLIIDVDDFKDVNDTLGHVTGDVVLSEICGTIKATLRSPDTLSRWAGDEFAVILPHTEVAGACVVAERIVERIRELTIAGHDDSSLIRCSVSIGVAQLASSMISTDDFVHAADERLYQAKRAGKNRYMF